MRNAHGGMRRGELAERRWRKGVTAAAVVLAAMTVPAPPAEAQGPAAAWPMSGQNIDNTHNAPDEHQLGSSNVSGLTPRWVLTNDGNVTTTPAVVDGIVYVPDYGGSLWTVEAATGKAVWKHKIGDYSGVPKDVSRTSPAYWGSGYYTRLAMGLPYEGKNNTLYAFAVTGK